MTFTSESEESERGGITTVHKELSTSLSSINNDSDEKTLVKVGKPIIKKYVCTHDECEAKFSRPWKLAAHIEVKHSGLKPFPCKVDGCGKKYTSLSHLRRHTKIIHTLNTKEGKIYKCNYPGCRAILKSKSSERKHFKRSHELKRFKCSDCPLSFHKNSMLKTHFYIHSGIPPLRCTICGLSFVRITEFRRHKRGHKIHFCPMDGCETLADKWSAIRKHILTDHKREWKCDHCGKLFKLKSYLKKHIENVHLNESTRSKPQIPVYTVQCHHCKLFYTTKGSLKRHILNIHLNKMEKSFKIKERKERAKRKDAGIPKKSMASILTGVDITAAGLEKMNNLSPNISSEVMVNKENSSNCNIDVKSN